MNFVKTFLFLSVVVRCSYSDLQRCRSCGGVFKARHFIINSPGYPKDYPPGICCDYDFISPQNCSSDIHIQFLEFFLEPSLNCTNDFLIVGFESVSDDEHLDTLCGRITGIRTYNTQNGSLRLRFVTNDSVQGKGFRMLITQLPCTDATTLNITTNESLHKTKEIILHQPMPKSLSSYQPILSKQYLPPLSGPDNSYSPWEPQGNGYYPQNNNFLPLGSCCRESFREHRFFISSPGFPSRTDSCGPRDCSFCIEKSSPNVCFLRIVFRFFAFGYVDPYTGQCLSDFIEIDGERICGCRTGFVYISSQWGYGPKMIRLRTNGFCGGSGSTGFWLDISQENCGSRYSRDVGVFNETEVFTLSNMTSTKILLDDDDEQRFLDDKAIAGASSRSFLGSSPTSSSYRCEFSLLDMLGLYVDPLWLLRQRC